MPTAFTMENSEKAYQWISNKKHRETSFNLPVKQFRCAYLLLFDMQYNLGELPWFLPAKSSIQDTGTIVSNIKTSCSIKLFKSLS